MTTEKSLWFGGWWTKNKLGWSTSAESSVETLLRNCVCIRLPHSTAASDQSECRTVPATSRDLEQPVTHKHTVQYCTGQAHCRVIYTKKPTCALDMDRNISDIQKILFSKQSFEFIFIHTNIDGQAKVCLKSCSYILLTWHPVLICLFIQLSQLFARSKVFL